MTVFTPVQLIATQQAKLAAMFALKEQDPQRFQGPVELNLLLVEVAPEKGVARRREAVSRTTPEIHAVQTTGLDSRITYQTPTQAIKSARSHLSADPPTAIRALQQGVKSTPRIAWQ